MRTVNIADELSEEDKALVAAGIMRLPEKRLDVDAFLKLPRTMVVGSAATLALLEERYADSAR